MNQADFHHSLHGAAGKSEKFWSTYLEISMIFLHFFENWAVFEKFPWFSQSFPHFWAILSFYVIFYEFPSFRRVSRHFVEFFVISWNFSSFHRIFRHSVEFLVISPYFLWFVDVFQQFPFSKKGYMTFMSFMSFTVVLFTLLTLYEKSVNLVHVSWWRNTSVNSQ